MKKYIIIIIWLAVISALIYSVCGCATFEAEIKGDDIKLKSATLGKDVIIDPNGVMSTVSPKNQQIVDALLGGLAGLLIGLGL